MNAPEAPPAGIRQVLGRLRTSHGVRAGAVLAVATLVFNLSSYIYNVGAIRYLGSSGYGDVAALLALGALVALPLASIQLLLAREVAQLPGGGAASRLLRHWVRIAVVAGGVLFVVGLVLSGTAQDLLNIESRPATIVGLIAIFPAIVATVLYGFLQGSLRFHALSVAYIAGGLLRPILVVPALLLGWGAAGAVGVTAVAGFVGVAVAAYALKGVWAARDEAPRPRLDHRQMAVMLTGSLAFASLTNVDILLAAYFLTDEQAGVYAAAALVGKAVLFLPAAIVTVLLPKAATRIAAGFRPDKILLASAAVTVVLTLTATGLLALVPESLLVSAFGGDFRESTQLLGWFGLAMSEAALVYVYLSVYFAERDSRFPLLMVVAAAVQIVAVIAWHPSPVSIVYVTLACFGSILVIHELFFPFSLARLWRDRHTGRPVPTPTTPLG